MREYRSAKQLAIALFFGLTMTAAGVPQAAKQPKIEPVAPAAVQKQASPEVQTPEMTPEAFVQARKAGRRILVIDVREPAQFNAGHVEDAINAPLPRLERRVPELKIPKTAELLAMCGTEACSSRAAAELTKMGYKQVSYCSMTKWDAAGLPKVPTKPAKKR